MPMFVSPSIALSLGEVSPWEGAPSGDVPSVLSQLASTVTYAMNDIILFIETSCEKRSVKKAQHHLICFLPTEPYSILFYSNGQALEKRAFNILVACFWGGGLVCSS
jgi:hypothetical protein